MSSPLDRPLTDTEKAVTGLSSTAELRDLLQSYARAVLGSDLAGVRLRAGRIDVVWGVDLADGRAVAVKAHRPPTDLDVLRAVRSATGQLAASGFPCPSPVSGPDLFEGHTITADALLPGGRMPDGADAAQRHLIVAGLADHIALLRDRDDLLDRVGPGPSWCRYHDGPWPVPHDDVVDLTETVPGYEWLDEYGRRAADQILAHRGAERTLGHADWYAGNLVIDGDRLVGSFDWEFVAEAEAVVAGFTAACFAAGPQGSEGFSSPASAQRLLAEYAAHRGRPFTRDEWAAAAGAVAWILAFNARWQVALLPHGLGDEELIERVRADGDAYLALRD